MKRILVDILIPIIIFIIAACIIFTIAVIFEDVLNYYCGLIFFLGVILFVIYCAVTSDDKTKFKYLLGLLMISAIFRLFRKNGKQ